MSENFLKVSSGAIQCNIVRIHVVISMWKNWRQIQFSTYYLFYSWGLTSSYHISKASFPKCARITKMEYINLYSHTSNKCIEGAFSDESFKIAEKKSESLAKMSWEVMLWSGVPVLPPRILNPFAAGNIASRSQVWAWRNRDNDLLKDYFHRPYLCLSD